MKDDHTKCHWKEDDSNGSWDTDCGQSYWFEYDLRGMQDGYKFCPGCGKEIRLMETEVELENAFNDLYSGTVAPPNPAITDPDWRWNPFAPIGAPVHREAWLGEGGETVMREVER